MWPDRRLLNLFKTEFPIVLAPMAGAIDADLAIAVAEGGGLGSVPCAMPSVEKAREQINIIRQRVPTPINVNFFCHQPVEADAGREAGWRRRLAPYYQELGLDPAAPVNAANRAPFDAAMCALVEELKPEIVSFHFGLPEQALFARVKAAGCLVMSSATTVKEAIWLEENGADVIIAQGAEAGGHRGMFLTDDITEQPGTFALVPQVVDAVKVPVIAAGGVADRRGIAAAFALGAAGVQIGTAYLRCPQSKVSAPARAALAHDDSTVITNVMTGRPARGVKNRVMGEVGPILAGRPGLSPCGDRARAAESGGRKARQGRFYQPLGRSGGPFGPRNAGDRADPGAGGRRAGADVQIGGLVHDPVKWVPVFRKDHAQTKSPALRRTAAVAAQKRRLLYGKLIFENPRPI
jgi:nitronate monooxygenase